MPKDRRGRSLSYERSISNSPYSRASSSREKGSPAPSQPPAEPPPSESDLREWEEARCPVCMEHPHNAVLLFCSSHDKGCRPFMCDTSRRHSNCLDQFRKAASTSPAPCQDPKLDGKSLNLTCPLCRGAVTSWTVVSAARTFMNGKARDCSLESCKFRGAYRELRKHARTEHSAERPSDANPQRQRDWTRMERQRDIGDLLSTIRPLIFDGGDEDELGTTLFMSPRFLISLYVRVPYQQEEDETGALPHPRLVISFGSRSGEVRGQRRPRPQWGELVDGGEQHPLADQDNDEDELQRASSSSSSSRRRRRRWMRMSDDEDFL